MDCGASFLPAGWIWPSEHGFRLAVSEWDFPKPTTQKRTKVKAKDSKALASNSPAQYNPNPSSGPSREHAGGEERKNQEKEESHNLGLQ